MTGTVFGPAQCRECGAVWQVVHVMLAAEGCIRCGGTLDEVASDQWSVELRRRHATQSGEPGRPLGHGLAR